METKIFCDFHTLSRQEAARLKRMLPEERRQAAYGALRGLDLDPDTRTQLEKAWAKA
jgi:hypothetical protein